MTEKKETITYPIIVDKDLWEAFKKKLTKDMTMQEAVSTAIEHYIKTK